MAKILVADDVSLIRKVIRKLLEEEGHEVLEASTVADTLKLYEREKPDLIILDLHFPEDSGLSFLRNMRVVDKKTPVIVLSAHDTPENIREAEKLGITAFLSKPPNTNRLIEEINNALAGKVTERKDLKKVLLIIPQANIKYQIKKFFSAFPDKISIVDTEDIEDAIWKAQFHKVSVFIVDENIKQDQNPLELIAKLKSLLPESISIYIGRSLLKLEDIKNYNIDIALLWPVDFGNLEKKLKELSIL